MTVIGIDLAGKPCNPTGLCAKQGDKKIFKTVYLEEEIISFITEFKPIVIAIDAPIMKGEVRVRLADKLLRRYGALPPTLESMRQLTIRGSRLAESLSREYRVIEVFPTATAKILKVYRSNYRETASLLGVKVRNKHELDAYLCCLTAEYYLRGEVEKIGDEEGGWIFIPKRN
ncbi:MAG TPA: DUF429 domain-containing protein [Thermoplasmatales archaeon]|nr:DUF429 domain-containing protein [Thermoplasmatales archaeon]